MLPPKRFVILTSLAALAVLPLGACANAPWAQRLQRSLAADPQLQENPSLFGTSNTAEPEGEAANGRTDEPTETAQLPANFPAEIPRYPDAELVSVTSQTDADPSSAANEGTQTLWTTADDPEQIQQFYQDAFESNGWTLVSQPQLQDTAVDGEQLVAERDGLQVTVTVPPTPADGESIIDSPAERPDELPANLTRFTIEYVLGSATVSQALSSDEPIPQPGDPDFIGPVLPPDFTAQGNDSEQSPSTETQATARQSSQRFTDLNQAPEELRQYITDLAALGVLQLRSPNTSNANSATANSATANEFKPNQTITRREYARWLVAANNQIYSDRPARKIRLGVSTSQPAFTDVPTSDPDFAAIQGLAEAGLIPSSLSGSATTVNFRPDASLTREDLILWKTPVDIRQTLPNASIDAVQQAWGFQDAARIEPQALRAVLADYQNGDLSNIRRAFGYTTLFQPKKPVTRAEAAAVLWYFGSQGEGLSAKDAQGTANASN